MNSSENQPSKLGKFLDGRKLPPSSQYSIAITTIFLIMNNNGTKQMQLQNETSKLLCCICYYLSLPLVESCICNVNKKENNNVIIQR